MAELVGGALLSGFLNVLFDRLATKEVVEFFRGNKRAVAEHLYELNARLVSANKLLNDAEEKQLKDQEVKKWLDELKDVVCEADHALDRINTEALRRRMEEPESVSKTSKFLNFIPALVSAFENSVKTELAEITRKLKILLEQAGLLGLKEHCQSGPSCERLLAPLVEEGDVCGRKAEKEAIVRLLLSDDAKRDKITVIPIVGMGGVGKTTLAQLVYNDGEVQEHFDLKLWAIVSENFDVPRITRTILEMIVENYHITDDPNKLQNDLKCALKGKKFLLVLDDVWSESYDLWDVLRSSFESGEQGSKIIVTTRNQIVASNMGNVSAYDLQTISYDDCWNLFAKHVGFDKVDTSTLNPDLLEIGVEIVKKCKGLPLAVKSIAGLLRSVLCPDEWRRILQSDMWELQNINIIPALWLSYRFLPPHLKRCFAYFSRFPKDYEFDESEREKIILLWMAEGLLHDEKGKRSMEEVGKEYLNALISRSFFQRSSRSESTLVIHDLLHDLAIHVSGESSLLLGRGSDEIPGINSKTRHLLYWKMSKDQLIEFEGLSEAYKLSTFLALPLSSNSSCSLSSTPTQKAIDELLLTGGVRLRALSLSNSSVMQLPDTFDNLKHLRYLDLSWTKLEKLPDSICILYNLQTLLLSHCEKLKGLPTNICNLINLRNLDVRGTPFEEMPPKMGHMKNLQTLSDFVIGENDGPRMKELGELQLLHGSLRISGLENVLDVSDVSQANLKKKEFLGELILCWDGETDDSTKEREVLNELRPHTKLKELEIDGFRGTTFPDWVGHQSFVNMVKVSLIRCRNCCLLPPLGRLPSLKALKIEGMDGVISIGDEFSGTSLTQPFPSLENLTMDGMDLLTEWSFTDQEGTLFPSLKLLKLEFCRRLNFGLPAGHFPSLKGIRIVSCRSMEAVFPASRAPIDAAYPSLESVQILRCPKMESFSKTGLPCSVKRLEIHDDCEALFANRMSWDLQRLSSLRRLELSGCRKAVDSFPEEGLLPPTLTRLRIDSFRSLKVLNGRGFRQLSSLQQLSICECGRLKCLPDEALPLSLSYLCVFRCPSLTRRCQRNVGEDWPKIQHIPLIIINRERI